MTEQNTCNLSENESVSSRVKTALDRARENPDSVELAKTAFLLVVGNMLFDFFDEGLELMAPHVEAISENSGDMLAFGYAAWVTRNFELAQLSLRRSIDLDPTQMDAYRFLVNIYLTEQKYSESLGTVLAAQKVANDEKALGEMLPLIEYLNKGIDQVNFELDGVEYVFGLSCFNGQAIEADIRHCSGLLVEYDELKYLKTWLPPLRKIVECGCLVGNHPVFFLKNLSPNGIDIFDESERSLAETARNIGLNARDDMDTVVNCNHRAIGRESGAIIELLGQKVETISLADAIDAETDFVKIDIDGMEREALDGLLVGLERSRAHLMVEVKKESVPMFMERLGSIGYKLDNEIVRHVDHNLFFSYFGEGLKKGHSS